MANYKCFDCQKEIEKGMLGKKVRCPYCGSRIFFKVRNIITKVKAE